MQLFFFLPLQPPVANLAIGKNVMRISLNKFHLLQLRVFFLFSCIFILDFEKSLSRESDQCAIRARLGVAGHLSTTPRWGNPAKCLSQRHNK